MPGPRYLARTRAVASAVEEASFSTERLNMFLEAEVTHFAAMRREDLTLHDLLCAAASPQHAAAMVHEEIPKHFAKRMRSIEQLEDWSKDPDLTDLHGRYWQSFREMRLTEVADDLAGFTEVVRNLKGRQKLALTLLGRAIRRRREGASAFDSTFWNDWLYRFLRSRISTEMLTSQYIAIINQHAQGTTPITGIVDPQCDPSKICDMASQSARWMCLQQIGVEPIVEVEVRSKGGCPSFSYIPLYLHYILLEVLKNSCKASAEAAMAAGKGADLEELRARPVQVVICSDSSRVAMRISDLAGGIPFDVGDRVWDFGFSGSTSSRNADPDKATVLSGYGLGLPLARLYARYLGGSLSLVSLPEYGVDTYLSLPRIDVEPFLSGSM